MNPLLGIVFVLLALGGLLTGCRWLSQRLDAEAARKAVHIGMGLICATFPWLFTEDWPVLTLALLAVAGLVVMRSLPVLKASVGSALHGVERFSLGEIYFPLAVALVWLLTWEDKTNYVLSILVLALADAVAALIGSRYGKRLFSTQEGHKSWEGSSAFFVTTFVCIFCGLQLSQSADLLHTCFLAVLIGFLVMIMEAIAWRGLDNLLIPLSCCLLLATSGHWSFRRPSGDGL